MRANLSFYIGTTITAVVTTPAEGSARLRTESIRVSITGQSAQVIFGRCKGQEKTPPRGVLTLLHGRGGHNAIEALAQSFASFACARELAVLVPASPTPQRNWPFEKTTGEGQDLFLLELLQKKARALWKLNSDTMHVVVGISAGATFLMGDFYPRHGSQLFGFAAALCGGSWPTFTPLPERKHLAEKFPLFVRISRKDFLFQQTEKGLARYAELGLPLRAQITHEEGHCAFDMQKTIETIAAELK